MNRYHRLLSKLQPPKELKTLLLFFLCLAVFLAAIHGIKKFAPLVYQQWLYLQAEICCWLLSAYADALLIEKDQLTYWLVKNEKPMVAIVPNCLIDRSVSFYCSFLIVQGMQLKRLTKFLLIGLLLLFTFNTFRIISLGELHLWKPNWYDYAHEFLLPLTEYFIVFLLWAWIVKTNKH